MKHERSSQTDKILKTGKAAELRRLVQILSERRKAPVFAGTVAALAGVVMVFAAAYAALLLADVRNGFQARDAVVFAGMFSALGLCACAGALWLFGVLLLIKYGLTAGEREFLALNLPKRLSSPLGLGALSSRVIYHGNCLFARGAESPEGYVHAFYLGAEAEEPASDTGFWRALGRSLPANLRAVCSPGNALRQAQRVESLPKWSDFLDGSVDGHALGGVLDHNYETWARKFLDTAARRLGANAETLSFFLTRADCAERKALLVCVTPRRPQASLRAHSADQPVAA